jgi:hypothetical protein
MLTGVVSEKPSVSVSRFAELPWVDAAAIGKEKFIEVKG